MTPNYEGSGTARFLKVFAVINGILAAIGAIAVWTTATQPRIALSGGLHIERGVNPATVVAGVLVLGEGILVSFVTFAIGVTLEHVIALRRQIDSGTSRPAPAVAASAAESRSNEPPGASSGAYRLLLIGPVTDARKTADLLRDQSNWHWNQRELRRMKPGTVVGSSLTAERAQAIKNALAGVGTVVEIEPEPG